MAEVATIACSFSIAEGAAMVVVVARAGKASRLERAACQTMRKAQQDRIKKAHRY